MNPDMPIDGPIPGENYTSDTKNYPWHRPPEIVDYDDIVAYVIGQMNEPRTFSLALTMMEAGASITGVVSMLNMINISDGKYPIDTSILAAGPIARYLQIMAKANDVDARVGNENDDEYITLPRLQALAGTMGEDMPEDMPVEAPETPVETPSGGLMGVPPLDSLEPATEGAQRAMLGYEDEEGFVA